MKEINRLEKLWAKHKYLVLSKSQNNYKRIRNLLKDKDNPKTKEIEYLISISISLPDSIAAGTNAAEHIWGYFKKFASIEEKESFQKLIYDYRLGKISYKLIKEFLKRLLVKYPNEYLSSSSYFDSD